MKRFIIPMSYLRLRVLRRLRRESRNISSRTTVIFGEHHAPACSCEEKNPLLGPEVGKLDCIKWNVSDWNAAPVATLIANLRQKMLGSVSDPSKYFASRCGGTVLNAEVSGISQLPDTSVGDVRGDPKVAVANG